MGYENLIDLPWETFSKVVNLWNIVADNQKFLSYDYEIICYDKNYCIINWKMKRIITKQNVSQEIDGIFQISLNNESKCIFFKQDKIIKFNNEPHNFT